MDRLFLLFVLRICNLFDAWFLSFEISKNVKLSIFCCFFLYLCLKTNIIFASLKTEINNPGKMVSGKTNKQCI